MIKDPRRSLHSRTVSSLRSVRNSFGNVNTSTQQESTADKLYQDNLKLNQQVRQLEQQNSRLAMENAGMQRDVCRLTHDFHRLQQEFMGATEGKQILGQGIRKHRRRNRQLAQQKQQLQLLKSQLKETRVVALKKEIEQLEAANIHLQADIYSLTLSNKWLEGKRCNSPKQATFPVENIWWDTEGSVLYDVEDTDRLEQPTLSNHNRDHYSKVIEGLLKDIQRERLRVESLQATKNSQLAVVEQYNQLNRKLVEKNNLKEGLDRTIDHLSEKIVKLNLQLDTQHQTNQDLKSKLFGKEDHEVKETKNLRDEIEKCTEQCREIRQRYKAALDRNNSRQDFA